MKRKKEGEKNIPFHSASWAAKADLAHEEGFHSGRFEEPEGGGRKTMGKKQHQR